MKIPDYTATIRESRACPKEGRGLLLKLCVAVLTVVGVVAVTAVIWAEITFFDLNSLPWIPRILLAAVAILACVGIFQSIDEEEVELKLAFYKDRLILTRDRCPSLWREDAPSMVIEILYKDVTGCIYSTRRLRVTFQTKGYTQTLGDGEAKRKSGALEFSTLKAPDVDFAQLIEKHSPIRTVTKN